MFTNVQSPLSTHDVRRPPVGRDLRALAFARFPEAELRVTPTSGHAAYEPETTHELIVATERCAG